jgi:uncharacterized phiE125 gp8 family phage protein
MKMDDGDGGGATGGLRSLVSLGDFKSILGVDEREEVLSRYSLVTATCAIEQYCMRRLVRGKHTDYHGFSGQYVFTLREYPVRKVLSVYVMNNGELTGADSLVNPDNYFCLPDEGIREDIPFSLVLRPLLWFSREGLFVRVRYAAGYVPGRVPADLAAACLELAAWNMSRYRGRRIGMSGKGEQFEVSMPENVKSLVEPYRRKVI